MNRVVAASALATLVLVAGCEDDERVPATPEALAAVALEHADVEPTLVEGSSEGGDVRASIRFDEGQQLLSVGAQDDGTEADEGCEGRGTCAVVETDAGDVGLYWEDEEPEEDPGIVVVTFATGDGLNIAYYAGDRVTGDPRDLDLGVDVDEMVAIVTDERFGTSTTREMTEVDVPGWAEDPGGLTPRTIAHELTLLHQTVHKLAAYEVDASAYGDGSIGATLELDDDITLTGYHVPDADQADLCPTGWVCEPGAEDGVLTGKPRGQVNDFAGTSPLRLLVAVVDGDGHASVVVREGPTLAGYDPTESMVRVAGLIPDHARIDADDLAEIGAIWDER
ncbi:hypothetical protein [Nocardioides currus]|uniref:Lipoprotein n=1 Tax=Nocardioides currus TaxID=2133958 RepID=A0A2R7YXU7_9ACTN|nr:hypothetical protein [Nocardioides currus]PUA81218.1 hypothetical protein C7S10_09270 [Nocardioides currus]